MKRIVALALTSAVILAASVAMAQVGPDSAPGDLVSSLWDAWGQWPVFAGIVVGLLIQAWRIAQPLVFEKLDPRVRRAIPLAIAGLTALSISLIAGDGWQIALKSATVAWVTALGSGDVLIGLFGKPASKPATPPSATTTVLFIALAALLLGGCAPTLASSSAGASLSGAKSPETCKRLSSWESGLRYGAVAGAAVAGGAGLTAIPVEDPDARRNLAIAAGSTAVVAGVAEVVRAELASDYVEGCVAE